MGDEWKWSLGDFVKGFFNVAVDLDGGIGKEGGFPWPRIDKDVTHFEEVTKNPHCEDESDIFEVQKYIVSI